MGDDAEFGAIADLLRTTATRIGNAPTGRQIRTAADSFVASAISRPIDPVFLEQVLNELANQIQNRQHEFGR